MAARDLKTCVAVVEPLTDLDALLGRLQRNDVRVAICTTDTRNGTIALLQHLDIVVGAPRLWFFVN